MNRLANASSPYLRQHADNPVHWYEWSEEAFARAAAEDKPVFLSVGYSSCHWCHVMAHESFEDDEVAALLNRHFVSVKVDREERPDVDSVYMDAVQALTGRGGWPMSVFCTPDGKPFFAGTYWPKHDRQGMPGFVRILAALAELWDAERDKLLEQAEHLTDHLRGMQQLAGAGELDPHVPEQAARGCVQAWDREHGGFGSAPKFPQAMTVDFLLAHHLRTGDEQALRAATSSLANMARGGIADQVGGGFHRYSVDAVWLVPHFEKMLYDNALLLRAYTHAWQITGDPQFRRVATETAEYLLRELRHEDGAFFSATDADSEGVEGKFFVWTDAEFREVVTAAGEDADLFARFYGVTPEGNFADPHHPGLPPANVLHEAQPRDERDEGFALRLAHVRSALRDRREARVHPGLDDKVLTSWNALALGALAEAGAALHLPRYVHAAQACARFLQQRLIVDGELQHTWKEGFGARVPAFLEDVAYLAQALLVLYETSHDPAWFAWARELAAEADGRFADDDGTYFTTAHDAERLLTRPKDLWDNATPAGPSVMADVHLRLFALTGAAEHRERAEHTLRAFASAAVQAPTGFGELLRAYERLLGEPQEVAIVGDPDDGATRALVARYFSQWRPASVLGVGSADSSVPLLSGRTALGGRPTAYVCRGFTCDRPVTSEEELDALLAGTSA